MKMFFTALCFIGLTGCTGNSAKQAEATTPSNDTATVQSQEPKAVVNSNNSYQNTALYLAGLAKTVEANVPAALTDNNAYKLFSDTMNIGFSNMEKNRFVKMREWAKTELAPELASPKTVFYPFSGPDILHCVQFYPDADQYIMIALEKYGSLPNLQKMDSAKAGYYLSSVTKSLEDIFGKSYFITRKMLKDVSNSVNGVVPLVSVFLVRTGFEIKDIQYKHLNDDGTFTTIVADACGKQTNDLVEIYFTKPGSDKMRKIVYFKTNLCDEPYGGMPSFTENKALQNYLNKMPECYTYVKSASYLMNYGTFSIIRNICLAKSKSILQDDTGIAFRYVDKSKWNYKLYGSYIKPVDDFSGVWQDDLSTTYKKDSVNVKKLAFSLGYHWGNQAGQNLMKFERK